MGKETPKTQSTLHSFFKLGPAATAKATSTLPSAAAAATESRKTLAKNTREGTATAIRNQKLETPTKRLSLVKESMDVDVDINADEDMDMKDINDNSTVTASSSFSKPFCSVKKRDEEEEWESMDLALEMSREEVNTNAATAAVSGPYLSPLSSNNKGKGKSSKQPSALKSRFAFGVGTSSSTVADMEVELSTVAAAAAAARRDKFVSKLGTTVAESKPGKRPRRMIVSEDEDEEEEEICNETGNKKDDDDYIDDAPSKKTFATLGGDDDDDDDDDDDSSRQRSTIRNSLISAPASATTTTNSRSRKKAKVEPRVAYTPLEKQYVEIKAQYPDAVLFVEVGYKYKFFGEDAQIASKELGIMHFFDHNFYTASIPVHRLDVHVRRLVHAGHKVGVVRQMETAALKSVGDNKSAPFTRKLANLYTKATFIESMDQDSEQFGESSSSSSSNNYIMCLVETPLGGSGTDESVRIGLMAVQPSTGDILYDDFKDGYMRNELETRLLHIQPSELILPATGLGKATEKLVGHLSAHGRTSFGDEVRVERSAEGFQKYNKAFTNVSEFYAKKITAQQEQQKQSQPSSGSILDNPDNQHLSAIFSKVLTLPENVMIALSAMLDHLSEFGLAHVFQLSKGLECFSSRSHMLLNGNTLSNLEIYRNQTNFTTQGSLFQILDHTSTAFGKRLLKKWVGKPLIHVEALNERVDAVEEILEGRNLYLEKVKGLLKGLIDLEKGVCRIHYGKATPKEFFEILKTFAKVSNTFSDADQPTEENDFGGLRSPMLRKLVSKLSLSKDRVTYFQVAFVESKALDNEKIGLFKDGFAKEKWPELEEHVQNISQTESDLGEELTEIRSTLRDSKLDYKSVSGIDYLTEVLNKNIGRVPKSWIKISGTKQVSRFHSPTVTRLIHSKAQHLERLQLASEQAFLNFMKEFSDSYEIFRNSVQDLAVLDCLFSLATVACRPGYIKPKFLVGSDGSDQKTCIKIKQGRHPMVEQRLLESYVANDVDFSDDLQELNDKKDNSDNSNNNNNNNNQKESKKTMILTGPNMGGKSSYIRQVALLCIMGQIGSYIPAESATLGILDAVYTRMGASDNLFSNQSTFMVELSETAEIMKLATNRSLVILDELGRGTSTLDGLAIAYAVLHYFVTKIQSITLFVTHYPSLAELAKMFPNQIGNFHMGFMTSEGVISGTEATILEKVSGQDGGHNNSNDNNVNPSIETAMQAVRLTTNLVNENNKEEQQPQDDDLDLKVSEDDTVVFLYKLMKGVSMKSYGLNVARLANLPRTVVLRAKVKSKELEKILEARKGEKNQRMSTISDLATSTLSSSSSDLAKVDSDKLATFRNIMACKTEADTLKIFS